MQLFGSHRYPHSSPNNFKNPGKISSLQFSSAYSHLKSLPFTVNNVGYTVLVGETDPRPNQNCPLGDLSLILNIFTLHSPCPNLIYLFNQGTTTKPFHNSNPLHYGLKIVLISTWKLFIQTSNPKTLLILLHILNGNRPDTDLVLKIIFSSLMINFFSRNIKKPPQYMIPFVNSYWIISQHRFGQLLLLFMIPYALTSLD